MHLLSNGYSNHNICQNPYSFPIQFLAKQRQSNAPDARDMPSASIAQEKRLPVPNIIAVETGNVVAAHSFAPLAGGELWDGLTRLKQIEGLSLLLSLSI